MLSIEQCARIYHGTYKNIWNFHQRMKLKNRVYAWWFVAATMLSDLTITNEVYFYFSIPPLLKFKFMIDKRLITVPGQLFAAFNPIFHWLCTRQRIDVSSYACWTCATNVTPVLSLLDTIATCSEPTSPFHWAKLTVSTSQQIQKVI